MGWLDWMNRGGQTPGKSPAVSNERAQPKARIKQPGDPFKRGDRIVVYESFHLGRELKPDPHYAPGVVTAVYHRGTLVSYERGGRLPANAAVEDIRHATEQDTRDYAQQFAAIEAKQQRRNQSVSWER